MDARTMDECLAEAGCPEDTRAQVARLAAGGHGAEALPALASFRAGLLAELHEADRRLACVDAVIAGLAPPRG